jgi:flagellar biosynthesis protein FlhA
VGYRLITLVDKDRQGRPAHRIKGVRKKFAQEVGFLPPPVHIRDNLELKPSAYRMTLRGAVVGEGEAFPGMFLAINPGGATTAPGHAHHRPGLRPARGVDRRTPAEAAQMAGLRWLILDRVATHLSHLMQVKAAKLLGRTETQQLVEHVTKLAPKLIEDVVPKMVGDRHPPESAPAAAGRGRAHPRHALHRRMPGRTRRHRHRPGRAGRRVRIAPGTGHRAADLRPGASWT